MCVQTHLCVHQCGYKYPIHRDVKIIFHFLLWFMSALNSFFPSSQTQFYTFSIIVTEESTQTI